LLWSEGTFCTPGFYSQIYCKGVPAIFPPILGVALHQFHQDGETCPWLTIWKCQTQVGLKPLPSRSLWSILNIRKVWPEIVDPAREANRMRTCGYGSIPIHTIFSGMNIHKSQLFWCSLQGYQGFDPSPCGKPALICFAGGVSQSLIMKNPAMPHLHRKNVKFWIIPSGYLT
jgi:hypothetical protein